METIPPSVLAAGPVSTRSNTPQPTQINGTPNHYISQWIAVHRKACAECRRKHISCEHINVTAKKRIGPGTACDRCKSSKRRCVGVPSAGFHCSRCRTLGVSCSYENKTRKNDRWVNTHANSTRRESPQDTLTQVDANTTAKVPPQGALIVTNKEALDRTENHFGVNSAILHQSNNSSHMEVDQDALAPTNSTILHRVERQNLSFTNGIQELVKDRFYGVPAENRAFVDRPAILASMEIALNSPSNGCRILALKGLGGMGKTQLMLRYCYLHRTAYEYVFWLEVDSWSSAVESFHSLAINLGLDEGNAKGEDSENKVIDWVRSWFENKTKWLLLLNNADDTMSRDVSKLLPRIGGDIILTTREPISSKMAIVISVDKMQQEEALSLLFGVSSIDLLEQNDQKLHYARETIIELDFMPLAIDLARAYISNTPTSFKNYLSLLKNNKNRLSLLSYNDEDDSNYYKHNVATVWQLSFEKIRALNPATVQILEACAFLQPEAIPVRLFKRQYSPLQLTTPSTEAQDNGQFCEVIGKAITLLVKFSFVTRTCQEAEDGEENPESDVLTIHRLVQKVIYDTMSDELRLRWTYNLATALNKDTCYDQSNIYALHTRRVMDPYIPHILHFTILLDNVSQKPLKSNDICELLDRVIWYLIQHGRYSVIPELVQFSRVVSEATYGEEDERIVRSLFNHAEFHQKLGKYFEAEPLFKHALTIDEKANGSEHPDTARLLNKLANVYSNQGKYDEAEPLYKRALVIREKALGSSHPETAQSLNNLAILYKNRGNYDEAESLYKQALVTREKTLGSENPDTAQSLNNLANLYRNRGKYDEAEPLYQRALVIYEKALGSEHPRTAYSLNNLASLYYIRGKYDEAEPLFKRALRIREKAFGLEHPDTAWSFNCLATLYKSQGKYNEAELVYKRAMAVYEKAFRSEHPDIALLLNNLALLYNDRGKYDEAELLFNRSLAINEKTLGSEHPQTACSLNSIATLYHIRGKYDEAEPLFKRALGIREKAFGLEHPDTAWSLNWLATLYKSQGKYYEAEPLYKQALTIQEKMLNPTHPDTASVVNNLGNLYKSQGKFDDAEALYQRALNILERMLGPMHPVTANSVSSLGSLYILQGKYDVAEPLCKQALAIREEMLGPKHPDTATSVNNMGELYMGQGRHSDAEPLIQRALAIREQVLGPMHPDTAKSAKYLANLKEIQAQHNYASATSNSNDS